DVQNKKIEELIPPEYLRESDVELPEVSEPEAVRHFVNLSIKNHHIDNGFYPLGSCTMKYNPKVNEETAKLEGFRRIHPFEDERYVQGALRLMKELEDYLCEILGVDAVSLQPAAGSQGELAGILIAPRYFQKKGEKRKKIIIPDSAHGTNPASVAIGGFNAFQIKSNENGRLDMEEIKRNVDRDTALLMVTNPNTLGLFEEQIFDISKIVHQKGALMYMDGANLNALMGITRPGDMGFDIVHINLHKTFSTPHGGGGPGSGPLGVVNKLEPFLPVPRIVKEDGSYRWNYNCTDSIGRVHSFFGNFSVFVKAYTYIRILGAEGLKNVSENAIINANYLMKKLENYFTIPYKDHCMHEFVASGENLKKYGVRTIDIAKRLLDFGFHSPTIYFPLIVKEALMIEPTETESRDTLNSFAEALIKILKEAKQNPEILRNSPHHTPVRRLDEAKAGRELDVKYNKA
ncbi:MAG: aminomethyl-transferring glycine dehydrogenase subunit GcvPB, partial [Candidatus Helarchaeota archaeon]|nr:aminomethyl-transferring glycine dehydrogenase subunit GcvPB [Candidatus Helarchaeota archaeon]